jgi:quercetin dioxygenase-like cupin family protein
MTDSGCIVRATGEGEQRWFFGGGLHTWKATAEETNDAFLLFEDHMQAHKMTPFHTHPADEVFYVLDGAITVHVDGRDELLEAGACAVVLRGVPHAFMANEDTRLLCMQTPGTGQAFFRHASEAAEPGVLDGPVDFGRVQEAARAHGGVELLGPPPFRSPAAIDHAAS